MVISQENRGLTEAVMSVGELIVLGPGEGKTVAVLGDWYTYKAVGRDTDAGTGVIVAALRPRPARRSAAAAS